MDPEPQYIPNTDPDAILAWKCPNHGVIPETATHLPNRDNIRTCVWCGDIVEPIRSGTLSKHHHWSD
jgi:hypothetical protein